MNNDQQRKKRVEPTETVFVASASIWSYHSFVFITASVESKCLSLCSRYRFASSVEKQKKLMHEDEWSTAKRKLRAKFLNCLFVVIGLAISVSGSRYFLLLTILELKKNTLQVFEFDRDLFTS